MALEPEFWAVLDGAAHSRALSLAALVAGVDAARGDRPLASALRLHALAIVADPAKTLSPAEGKV